MKKLLLAISIAFSTIAANGQVIYKSLNGYTQTDAQNMIRPFLVVNTQPPQLTSVWFDKSILQNIITLLDSEYKQRAIQHLPLTDGVRIYFAYDNFNQQTVVLVSTYDSGVKNVSSPENSNYHEDYYDHLSNAALFNMKLPDGTDYPISGKVCHDHSSNGGALLYTTSGLPDDPNCDDSNPHYLKRSQCEQMAQNFDQKADKISTTGEWFDLNLIRAFANEINRKPTFDGIRIYFAKHPANDKTFYQNKDAFVIVTTQTIIGSNPAVIMQDYFDCSTASEYFKKYKSKFKHFTNGQDNGQLCPYNCN